MPVSLQEFIQDLLDNGLMSEEELRAFEAAFPADQRPSSAMAMARELVRQQKLTSFQATRLAEGSARGLVLGNNILLEKIGEGGMGEVFKAEHRRMKRPVVVKILPAAAVSSEYAVKRFQREVEAAAQLSHPNIVTAYDADEVEGIHFLVMEYVDGQDLGTLIRKHGPMSVGRALDCVLQVARGLEYAHAKGIVHRDIKPGNLLLDSTGTVKILDMGLARMEARLPSHEGEQELTSDRQILGTVDYLSPEQADNSSDVDARTDIYSLGCTMFRLLTGSPPYPGSSIVRRLLAHRNDPIPSLRERRPDAPQPLDGIFRRMVAKSPADRYSSMSEVIAELQACLDALDFDVGPPSIWPHSTAQPNEPTQVMNVDAATANLRRELTRATSRRPGRPRPRQRAQPAVGIDLGTTFSALAYLDDLGRPQTLINGEGDKITPSVLLFDDDEVVVGKEALKAMATEMEAVAQCAKRELGQRVFQKSLAGHQYPPQALEAWILHRLHSDARQQIGDFQKVVITVPAYFDEVRRKATQDAGYIAGLEVMDIINEPTAAALAFGFQQGYLRRESGAGQCRNILIYDLGGGTFDVTVMQIGGSEFVTLATDGDMRLGGRDWDQRLVDYVAKRFQAEFHLDPRDDPNALGRLWRDCEDAKRTLSARNKAHVVCDYRGETLRVEVTRKRFRQLTSDLLDRTAFTTRQTLQASGLSWRDIDRVLLVGGSTRMPAVYDMLKQLSGKEPDRSVSPDEAVAHGAALRAGLLLDQHCGQPPSFQVANVNSHSLGIVATDKTTGRKTNVILIPRNTRLPAEACRVFSFEKAGQPSIRVQVTEGESAMPEECSSIGKCAVHDLPPDLPDNTPVEVRFRYEENGRLTVAVALPALDKNVQHELTRENALSREELLHWRQTITQRSAVETNGGLSFGEESNSLPPDAG